MVAAAAVGVPDAVKGEAIWCAVVLRPGADERRARRASSAAGSPTGSGRRSAPPASSLVPELPMTRSAKVVRRAIRAAAIGEDPGDLSSVENPAAVDAVAAAFRR